MCIRKKKKMQPPSDTVETIITKTESEVKRINEVGPKSKENTSKVAAMHKKREGRNKEISESEMRVQLEAAQAAMGVMPNTALVDRIHSRRGKLSEEISTVSKRGDIQFSLVPPKKKLSKEEVKKVKEEKKKAIKDDDTLHPLVKPAVLANNEAQDEEFVEDEIDEPNSENYMYNEKEIYYTCHDMIRELNVESDGITYDASAPLEELEKREMFTCQTLRRNTFLSNSLSMPNKDEQKLYKPKNHTRIVRFTTGVIDITNWGDSSCVLLTSSEASIRTQQSRSEFPRSTVEEKKTQELKTTTLPTQDSNEYRQSRTSYEYSKRINIPREASILKDTARTQLTSL
uniref:Uncharacterized protein n=1 Tax=Parascaris univalens TaxID=6257 RepID=A0A915BT59_PARUN